MVFGQKTKMVVRIFAAAINDLLHIVEKYNITPEQYEMGDIFFKKK